MGDRPRRAGLHVAAAACLGLSCGATSFAGSPPPAIDAAGYCRDVAELSRIEGSAADVLFDGCMRAEATARAEVSRVWSDVREGDQSACLTATPAASASNQDLADCIAAAVAKRFLEGDLHFCPCALRATLEAPR